MRLDWWTFALQTVNFAILVWLLHRFLYKPVLRMIDARRAEVQHQYDEARLTEEAAKARLAELEGQRAAIAAERRAALEAAAKEARQLAETRRAQTNRELQTLLDTGRKTLAAERERALLEVQRIALDLGAEFAQRLLEEVPMPLRVIAELPDRHGAGPQMGIDAKQQSVVLAAITEGLQNQRGGDQIGSLAT